MGYTTEPMTEGEFKHLRALYFEPNLLESDDKGKFSHLDFNDSYADYLEQCRHTQLKGG